MGQKDESNLVQKNLTQHVAFTKTQAHPNAEPSHPYDGSTRMRSQPQPPCEHLNNDRSVDIFIQLTHVCCGRCGTNGFCHFKQIFLVFQVTLRYQLICIISHSNQICFWRLTIPDCSTYYKLHHDLIIWSRWPPVWTEKWKTHMSKTVFQQFPTWIEMNLNIWKHDIL